MWTFRLMGLIAGFALGMLLMEVLLEALYSLDGIPRSIALWNSAAGFSCCSLLSGTIAATQRLQRSGKGDLAVDRNDLSLLIPESRGLRATLRRWAPYLALSAAQFFANAAANHAVHYVDFTVKVVFKASKLLPTMALSTFVGNARAFSAEEYTAALCLCSGTAMFSHGSGKGGHAESLQSNLLVGSLLLASACLIEGAVPNAQQWLMKDGVSANVLMLRMNIFGAAGGVAGLLLSGDLAPFLSYCVQTPQTLPLLLGATSTFAVSVACSTRLIQEAGTVFVAVVSTMRKTATVLLSFLLFPGKNFDAVRGAGLLAVLLGVVLAEHARSRPGALCRRPWRCFACNSACFSRGTTAKVDV